MSQLYVNSEGDFERARQSLVDKKPITISGLNRDGQIQYMTGVVHSVETGQTQFPGYTWRITIVSNDD